MTIVAVIGATALYLFFAWLTCAIIASYLSSRKGYGDRPGLAAGLLLTVAGVVLFLVLPAKPGSEWKVVGPFGRQKPGVEGLGEDGRPLPKQPPPTQSPQP